MICKSHLSKGPSYLKQKCTQLPTPFSGTVFNALSLGVLHFVQSVSLRNHFLVGWNSSTANKNFNFKVFKTNTLNKMDHTMWKSIKTMPENNVGDCVHFCLWPLKPLERCEVACFADTTFYHRFLGLVTSTVTWCGLRRRPTVWGRSSTCGSRT